MTEGEVVVGHWYGIVALSYVHHHILASLTNFRGLGITFHFNCYDF